MKEKEEKIQGLKPLNTGFGEREKERRGLKGSQLGRGEGRGGGGGFFGLLKKNIAIFIFEMI